MRLVALSCSFAGLVPRRHLGSASGCHPGPSLLGPGLVVGVAMLGAVLYFQPGHRRLRFEEPYAAGGEAEGMAAPAHLGLEAQLADTGMGAHIQQQMLSFREVPGTRNDQAHAAFADVEDVDQQPATHHGVLSIQLAQRDRATGLDGEAVQAAVLLPEPLPGLGRADVGEQHRAVVG